MKKKYLFFDIDGTLLAGGYENSYVPESAQAALKKLEEAGHFLAIATGRSQYMAVDYMKELGFHHMVSDGGYGITINDHLEGIKSLPKENVIKLINECKQKNLPWGIQVENSGTRFVPDSRFNEIAHDTYMETKIIPDLNPEDYENIYKAYVACDYPKELEIEALKELPWYRFHKEYFFVEPSDKAYGIKKVLDLMKADYADVIVFGDSMNDMSMFKESWMKVAMGNAIPELKELADYVTTSVDADGIYKACEKLGLFEKVSD